jgi:hypothetical protein
MTIDTSISSINIVCYEELNNWILGKFAKKFQSIINDNYHIKIKIDKRADSEYQVGHHIIYLDTFERKSQVETFMITHVDSDRKIKKIKSLLRSFDLGICMSKYTKKELVENGIKPSQLVVVNPAHDLKSKPKKITFGISSKLHSDGRKRESNFLKLLRKIPKEDYKLHIMGMGWQTHINELRNDGIDVTYIPDFDQSYYYSTFFSKIDYFIYWSWDEGSMAFLDAINADVKTIVSPQGFHLDIDNGIDYPVHDENELVSVMNNLINERKKRISRVENFTWKNYIESHLKIWEATYLSNSGAVQEEFLNSSLSQSDKYFLRKIYDQQGINRKSINKLVIKTAEQFSRARGLSLTTKYFQRLHEIY